MKKFIIILILFLSKAESSIGQTGPILPYKKTGHSLKEVETLALDSSSKSEKFRTELLYWINLQRSKKGLAMLEKKHLSSIIMDHTTYREVLLEKGEFDNSGWDPITTTLSFGRSMTKYYGYAAVFSYQGLDIILWKQDCANLLRVHVESTPVVQQAQLPDSERAIYFPPEPEREISINITIVNYNPGVNNTVDITNTNTNTNVNETSPGFGQVQTLTPINPAGSFGFGFQPTNFISPIWNGGNSRYSEPVFHQTTPRQVPVLRTMPSGIPATSNPAGGNNGGIPATSRGMPGGIR